MSSFIKYSIDEFYIDEFGQKNRFNTISNLIINTPTEQTVSRKFYFHILGIL